MAKETLHATCSDMRPILYRLRNYSPQDFECLVLLRAWQPGQKGYCTLLPDLNETIGHPYQDPEKNVFVVETAGGIAGYLEVFPEHSIQRAVCNFLLSRSVGSGIAKGMVACGLQRAGILSLRIAHVNIPGGNGETYNLFTAMGFYPVRRHLDMTVDLSQIRPFPPSELGCLYRTLDPGEEDHLASLQNRSFAGSWGYNPNTPEEIIHRLQVSPGSQQEVILAEKGNQLVGFCWTRTDFTENKARIYMLGVDPKYRRKGVGGGILAAGLALFKKMGLGQAELTVDSENRAAMELYSSAGFKARTHSLWLERELD